MRRVALILAGLACWVGTAAIAAPDAPPGAVVTRPDWVAVPNGDDLADQYPALAQFVGVGGHAVLHCLVGLDGSTACTVVEETPPGLGFGQAALGFAKTFKMKPMTVNGRPVAGGEINIPIAFAPPDSDVEGASPAVEAAVAALGPGTSAPAPNVSPRSTQLARQIAAITLGQAGVKPFKDLARETLIQQFGGSAKLTKQEIAALDDYVEALAATLDSRIAATADGYAQLFSEKELADIGGFFESASGRAWLDKSQRYAAKVNANMEGAVQAETRRRFCAQFRCPAPAAGASAAPAK